MREEEGRAELRRLLCAAADVSCFTRSFGSDTLDLCRYAPSRKGEESEESVSERLFLSRLARAGGGCRRKRPGPPRRFAHSRSAQVARDREGERTHRLLDRHHRCRSAEQAHRRQRPEPSSSLAASRRALRRAGRRRVERPLREGREEGCVAERSCLLQEGEEVGVRVQPGESAGGGGGGEERTEEKRRRAMTSG